MKQLFQDLRRGNLLLEEIPASSISATEMLVASTRSLISPGTERMLLEFGRAGYFSKARQQPEKLAQLYQKIRTDGFSSALKAVMSKLDQPLPLGYCNVGKIIEIGSNSDSLSLGDRVVSNAYHAEIVRVPKLLCAKVPDEVDDESAAFTVLGAVAMQGIRLLKPEIGETTAVFGLGLIGLLAVQILKASGVRVLAFDLDETRVELARGFGAEAHCTKTSVDPIKIAEAATGSHGVDAVLVCAATKSDELIHQAAQMCRKHGRIVLTGSAGLKLQRSDFYEKELSFQVSCAYGAGRYDPVYEKHGVDYPIAYARWTVQRNFEAVLALMKDGLIDVKPLISKRISFLEAGKAYEDIKKSSELGILLVYEDLHRKEETASPQRVIEHKAPSPTAPAAAIIGPGSFAQHQVLPVLKGSHLRLKCSVSQSGKSAALCARKFGFEKSSTLPASAFEDPEISSVFICTRHDSHAGLVVEALKHNKNVYVEKPLCLNETEMKKIEEAYRASGRENGCGPILMVGFNRRFAPLTKLILERLKNRSAPLSMSLTCNAGFIPKEHWVHNTSIGGGRITGELCHFIDLLSFLAASKILAVSAFVQQKGIHAELKDSLCVNLQFEDGSIGNINYFADGHRGYPKERLEIFSEGRVLMLDNFRRLEAFGLRGFRGKSLWKQDKGHAGCINAFLDALQTGRQSPIPFKDIVMTMQALFAVQRSALEKRVVELEAFTGSSRDCG